MNLEGYDLSALGSHAHGHYKAAEKHKEKAEQQYLSAGLYLKEAKQRVLKTRGMTFEKFLKDHCPIGRSRAYEVIAIADGTKTYEETKERRAEWNAKAKAEREAGREAMASAQADNRPEKPNENNERPVQDSQPDPVREAEAINENSLRDRIKACKRKLNFATPEQLEQIERILNVRT